MDHVAIGLVNLAVPLILGAICASIAQGRGRSAVGWFFVGFFLPCFGLILLLVLPDLSAEQDRHDQLRRDNRRMREQLKKDRAVAERHHEVANHRLGVHDQALGLDTAERPEDALRAPPQAPALGGATGADYQHASWFYIHDGQQNGPVAFDELKRMWRAGHLGAEDYLWHEGMTDWLTLKDMPDLEGAFRA